MYTDLWNHALALYARPGVEEACLTLQAAGGDVCLLLCATWLQRRGTLVSDERVQALRDIARPWQETVVVPLRRLRQQWRTAAHHDPQLAALREQLKGLELSAEKTLLERLQAHAQAWPAKARLPAEDWLTRLMPEPGGSHDALERLRVAASGLQDAEDGV